MGKVLQISNSPYELENEFSLSNQVGKTVIAQNGGIVGKVKDIVIKNYQIIGIIVSKYLKPDIFIENKFFDSFREDAVILAINPVTCLVGLPVLDNNGKKLGTVKQIIRESTKNAFTKFIVKKNMVSKELKFQAKDIKSVSQHIILRVNVD